MPYLGISPTRTDNRKIDSPLQRVGGGVGFNGVITQFYLTVDGEAVYPDTELLFQAILNGGQLNPKVDFTIQSNIITFAIAPSSGAIFFAILGDRVSLNKPGTDTVTTSTIKDAAVTTIKIADGSITADKIADGTIIAADVADGAITTTKLSGIVGGEAVTTAKIRDLNVTTIKIADLNVTTGKLADLGVTTGKIADLGITTGKIADLGITTGKIADLGITTGKIAAGAVDEGKILNSAVTTNKIATSAITDIKIANGAIGTVKISTGAVTPEKINLTVTSDPVSPVDGQFIWNTTSNSAKLYNSTNNAWDVVLTTTTGGELIGWTLLAAVPFNVTAFTERNTLISTETTINDFAYNETYTNPKYVAVSTNGKISSSSDLSSWTIRTSGTAENINCVSWGGSFFFAGANNNKLLNSSDGQTWNIATGPFVSSGSNITVSYSANNVQIIGGSLGEIASSFGSTTFSNRTSTLNSEIVSFAYGNGIWVAGSSSGSLAYSTDNTTNWSTAFNLGGTRKVFVEYYNQEFYAAIDVIGTNDVIIKKSTDGISWSDIVVNPPNINTIKSFKYSFATGGFIILNDIGVSYRSKNSISWALFNFPSFDIGTSISSTKLKLISVSGIEYYLLTGTKTVDAVSSSHLATATFPAVNNQLLSNKNYIIDTSYGTFSIQLPSNPNVGDIIRLADGANTWSTTTATVNAGSKLFLVSSGAIDATLVLDFSGVNIDIVWTGTYWRVY